MVEIVYLDTLFLFNFAINAIMLKLVRTITNQEYKLSRELVASMLCAVISVMMFINDFKIYTVPIKLITIIVSQLLAFGYGGIRRFVKIAIAYNAIYFSVGGGIYALSNVLKTGQILHVGGIAYFHIPFWSFAICFVLVYILVEISYKIFTGAHGLSQKFVEVSILIDDVEFVGKGLIDTGQSLFEPISGRSVIIAESSITGEKALAFVKKAKTEHVRIIPFRSMGGDGFLHGVRSESVLIKRDETEIMHKGIYIAFTDRKLSNDDSFNMILSHNIINTIGGTLNYGKSDKCEGNQGGIDAEYGVKN